MPTNIWYSGIGGVGDALVENSPLYTPGTVYYVSSTDGNDSFGGDSVASAKATLGAAVSAASDGDIIVLASDHDETVTAAVDVSKKLLIVGAGSTAGVPTATLRNDAAASELLTITASNVELRNIKFPENTQTNSTARVIVTSAQTFAMVGCYMECGDKDAYAVLAAANATAFRYGRFENCTFVSTATVHGTRPTTGISLVDALDVRLSGCIFDGGTLGFAGDGIGDGVACEVRNGVVTSGRIYVDSVSLLRGANLYLPPALVGGYVLDVTSTGGGRVIW